ncbi:MAG: YggS family pyridoxal phosphate-dependent enzyme [Candidatus Marinimicrobia bacterium]|nr:YggS family pyridoxal phosphate-dependent enzyme [Candidatus Neomarinimicrobiota bacterium]
MTNLKNRVYSNLVEIQEKISSAKAQSGNDQDIALVAVTKTHPIIVVNTAISLGLKHIGENRIQEAEEKFSDVVFEQGVVKRMIGHLQTNKARKAVKIFDTIDSVDSLKLAKKINIHANTAKKIIEVLLEINTSSEKQKFGFNPNYSEELLECIELEGLLVKGLMTIGPLTKDENMIRKAFTKIRNLKDEINKQVSPSRKMSVLSMGMTGDYEIAIEEGSNMIRIGSALFGKRLY